MFSVPCRYIYISYLVFHTVLTAAACFLPSADNYLSRLGFVTIACFLLATLSADNAPQILDRCRGICSGDAVRGIITALFSSPPEKKQTNPKQTHSLPWHRVRLASQHCVVLWCLVLCCAARCGAAALQLAGANYDLRRVPGASVPPSATNKTHLVSSTFPPAPSHLLTISSSYDLFTFTLPCFTFSLSPTVGLGPPLRRPTSSIITSHFTLH